MEGFDAVTSNASALNEDGALGAVVQCCHVATAQLAAILDIATSDASDQVKCSALKAIARIDVPVMAIMWSPCAYDAGCCAGEDVVDDELDEGVSNEV